MVKVLKRMVMIQEKRCTLYTQFWVEGSCFVMEQYVSRSNKFIYLVHNLAVENNTSYPEIRSCLLTMHTSKANRVVLVKAISSLAIVSKRI